MGEAIGVPVLIGSTRCVFGLGKGG